MATQDNQLVSAVGFSNGCALFMPKKPPPLVPNCLMGTNAATRPNDDRLLLGFAVIGRSHGARFERGDLMGALERHRAALLQKQKRHTARLPAETCKSPLATYRQRSCRESGRRAAHG